MSSALQGEAAPDFELVTADGRRTALRDLRGAPVILAFYPADWSPVCGDQMGLYNEVLPEFERYGARLLGISVDGMWCHQAFTENLRLGFPPPANFDPKGGAATRSAGIRVRTGS